MIDLMNVNLLTGMDVELPVEKKVRTTVKDGFQVALLARVNNNEELLKLEEGGIETVDLEDVMVWRQKKVKEKCIQLFSILAGAKLESRVLRSAFRFLSEKGGISNATFTQHLLDQGYSIGTAKAQAGQIVTLFLALKIVVRDAGTKMLLPNAKSLVLRNAVQQF